MKRTAGLGLLLAALCGCASHRDCCCCCCNPCCSVAYVPGSGQPEPAPAALPKKMAVMPQASDEMARVPEMPKMQAASRPPSKDGLEEIEAFKRTANRSTAGMDVTGSADAKSIRHLSQPQPANPPMSSEAKSRSGPLVRHVNSKRILLHYELRDAQAMGIVGVELWYTQDAKTWFRHDAPPHRNPPYVIEVSEEGVYGFTLLPCGQVGRLEKPPQPGDAPQIWIAVELNKPQVKLVDIKPTMQGDTRVLTILWDARDQNLKQGPITISFAEQLQGPWVPVVSNLENSGKWVWHLSDSMPNRFHLRIEAMDQVGNVGVDQTPHPILLSLPQPRATITGVDSSAQANRPAALPRFGNFLR